MYDINTGRNVAEENTRYGAQHLDNGLTAYLHQEGYVLRPGVTAHMETWKSEEAIDRYCDFSYFSATFLMHILPIF